MIKNPKVGMEFWLCVSNFNKFSFSYEKLTIISINANGDIIYDDGEYTYRQENNKFVYNTKEQAQAYYKRWLISEQNALVKKKDREIKFIKSYYERKMIKINKQLEKLV